MKNSTAYPAFLTVVLCLLLAGCSDDDPVAPGPQFTVRTFEVTSDQYLNNRFFRLDLPPEEANGRNASTEQISLASIKVFRLMGPGPFGPDDLQNVAVYLDSTGCRDWPGLDFTRPRAFGTRWRQIYDFDPWLNINGWLEAIDLRSSQSFEDILAVTYTVVDAQGQVVQHVGDDPSRVGAATQVIDGQGTDMFYRMKMLKAPLDNNDPHLFRYVLRNIYPLGGANLDPMHFDLKIESRSVAMIPPDRDEQGMPYVRIFGLDAEDSAQHPGADGLIDVHNVLIFDLRLGLLKFPLDFPQPFAATGTEFSDNVNDASWNLEGSVFLRDHLAPGLYDPNVIPLDYPACGHFRIVVRTRVPVDP